MPARSRLLEALPNMLLDEIANRAVQLGAGNELSLTCRAFSQANLLHSSNISIDLERHHCDELLTPRVVAALRSRTSKLAIRLTQPQKLGSRQYTQLLMYALDKLGSCAAVGACELCINSITDDSDSDSDSSDIDSLYTLQYSPGLAQRLVDSFPGLIVLFLFGYAITCSDLASLLTHPQLSLQLQKLDLTDITILQPQQPGAMTLDNLFHGARLKKLTLDMISTELPNLQPLAQHLTQLQLRVYNQPLHDLGRLRLASLAGLQVLSITGRNYQDTLPQLLQALPQLHTLHLPCTLVNGRQELDALLAATQLTNVQLLSMEGLAKPQAVAPCTWRQLKLTGRIDCATAACLPLHSLTQPLELQAFFVSAKQDSSALVEAAVRNLTQAGRLCVKIESLGMDFEGCDAAKGPQAVHRLVAELRPLQHCSQKKKGGCNPDITFHHLADVTAATLPLLAPLCQGCSQLRFKCGSVDPSLEFWCQLVQGMPTVRRVDFIDTRGTDSEAACAALRLMAEQPCSREFNVFIFLPRGCSLPERCRAIHKEFGYKNSTHSNVNFTVSFYATI